MGDGLNYQRVEDIFRDAKLIDIQERIRREVNLALHKAIYSEGYLRDVLGYTQEEIDSVEAIEPSGSRVARNWSELGSKVVGAEGIYRNP